MNELLTANQMRLIENAAIERGYCSGADLMERAGQAVVDATLLECPKLARTGAKAAVLAGPGNNGGDGFVIARLLRQRGWEVSVLCHSATGKWSGDAAAMLDRVSDTELLSPGSIAACGADVIIDAIFGAGLTRDVDLPISDADKAAIDGGFVVAVDGPSGLCLDTGKARGDVIAADLTVTFDRPKLGHHLNQGPQFCGTLRVMPIGLHAVATAWPDTVQMNAAPDPGVLTKHGADHKFDHGHLVVFGGGVGRGGAARLSARGALRIGAGLVTIAVPPAAVQEYAARLDAVMLASLRDGDVTNALLTDNRNNAFLVGPGFGLGEQTRKTAIRLAQACGALVLDADALRSFAEDPDEFFCALQPNTVLTPHGGEFGALFPDIAKRLRDDVTYSKVDATRDAAGRAGCVVLFKGPDTVIANAAGDVTLNSATYENAAPWLATAGAGDVLAGFIAGLLARGFSAFEAAKTATWLHCACARNFGPGLIAEDIPEQVPAVLAKLSL